MNFENKLNWSFSRVKMLRECERKYYHTYYNSFGGWLPESPDYIKQAFRLKQLQNINSVLGMTVHETAQTIIVEKITFDSVIAIQRHVGKAIKKYYCQSLVSKAKFFDNPKKNPMLMEVYYEGDVEAPVKQNINNSMSDICKTIYNSFDDITGIKSGRQVLELDELRKFEFDGHTCYLKIDLLTKDSSNRYYITDWKTGKYNENSIQQLLAYSYYVSQTYKVRPQDIECQLCFLKKGDVISFVFDDSDFKKFEEQLSIDFSYMKLFILPGTVNIPPSQLYFEESGHNCQYCNYREMCCS